MNRIVKTAMAVITAASICLSGCAVSTEENVESTGNISQSTGTGWDLHQVAMGGGGFVSGVFATDEKGLYYARTDVGGAYRYDSEAEKWISISGNISEDDKGLLGVSSLAWDKDEPNRVYLLTGTDYFSGGKTCLMASDDYGDTFSVTDITDLIKTHGNGMGRGNGERMAVDPKDGNILYVGGMSSGGLIKSTDGGKTFTKLDLGTSTITKNDNGICSILIDPESGDKSSCSVIYAAISRKGEPNLYKSVDSGVTWNAVESAPNDMMVQRMKYNGNGKIVITYADTEGPWNNDRKTGGVYVLDMSSDTFENITPSPKGYGDVVIHPEDPDKMVACTVNIYVPQSNGNYGDEFYVTTDGGKNWTNINMTMTMSGDGVEWHDKTSMHWCSSMAIDPNNPDKLMVVSGNGIFSCDNIWDEAPAFRFFAKGLEETVPQELVSIPGGKLITAIGDYDGFAQDDALEYGSVHSSVAGTMRSIAAATQAKDVWVKCGGNESTHGFWYTEDGGESWINVTNSPVEGQVAYGGAVGISADGKTFLWAPENVPMTYYTTDKGETWNECDGLLSASRISGDGVNPDLIYASSSSSFYYSTDGGKSFEANWEMYVFSPSRPIPDPFTEGKVYFASMGLQLSTDGGKTFTRLDSVASCKSVGLGRGKNEGDPCAIYIWGQPDKEDETGLYWSTDEGRTWRRINDSNHVFGGPGGVSFVHGDFNVYGRVYLSSEGLGVICWDLSDKS